MIILNKFYNQKLKHNFQVIWEIFLHMLIERIIIGVVILLQEHFSKEWIELLNRISGIHCRISEKEEMDSGKKYPESYN